VEGARRFRCRNAEILIRGYKYPTVSKVNLTGDSRSPRTQVSALSLARLPITESTRLPNCHTGSNLLHPFGNSISPADSLALSRVGWK